MASESQQIIFKSIGTAYYLDYRFISIVVKRVVQRLGAVGDVTNVSPFLEGAARK